MTEQNEKRVAKVDNLNHVQRYFYLRDGKNRRNICIAVLRQKGNDFTQIGVAVWNPKDSYDKGFAREVALKRAQKAYVINSVQPFRREWNSFTILSSNGIPKRERIVREILANNWHNGTSPERLLRAARRSDAFSPQWVDKEQAKA